MSAECKIKRGCKNDFNSFILFFPSFFYFREGGRIEFVSNMPSLRYILTSKKQILSKQLIL